MHTSLLEAQIAMLDFQASRWTIGHEVPPQAGNDHPTSVPTGVFPTSDGHINIAASGRDDVRRLCTHWRRLSCSTHSDYQGQRNRSRNRAALNSAIAEYTDDASSAGMGRRAQRGGCALRPDLYNRPDASLTRR